MKKSIATALVIVSAFGLAACDKKAEPAANTTEVAPPAAEAPAAAGNATNVSSAPVSGAEQSSSGEKIKP